MDEQAFQQLIQTGSQKAAEFLNTTYGSALERYCSSFLRDPSSAEDVVQETFLKLLAQEEAPRNLRSWLFWVARNACLSRLNEAGRRKAAPQAIDELELVASVTGQLTKLVRAEQRRELHRQLARLSEEQIEVLHLRYSEGLSRQEVADVLGIPESVVKSRAYEGTKKLRDALK
ncbi:MAG: RNA polymerase sigma factor [Planctomycetota bacterium]|nr:MAG: RNA polymerase sigma factor [Planctomycetota bacterium]